MLIAHYNNDDGRKKIYIKLRVCQQMFYITFLEIIVSVAQKFKKKTFFVYSIKISSHSL